MKYRLVAIDCDGTLINSDGMIPQENKEAILRCQELGVAFIIITGRSDIHVYDYVKDLGISAPVIGCNGASTRDVMTRTLLSCYSFREETLEKLFHYFEVNEIHAKLFGLNQGYYCGDPDEFDDDVLNSSYYRVLTQKFDYIPIQKYSDVIREELIKIVIIEPDEEKLLRMQREFIAIGGLEAYRSSRECMDLVVEGVSKGNGLRDYAEKLGVTPDEIVAIGDSENDIEMLQYAGFAVAMGNASAPVRSIAHYITDSHDNAGVAKALQFLFPIKD